jgi:stage V sporulation protein R
VQDFIANTMLGIEFLWGGPVRLETSEVVPPPPREGGGPAQDEKEEVVYWRRVLYTMENRTLTKENL